VRTHGVLPRVRSMPGMLLCVLLWAVPGREQQLIDYEDQVLPLLDAHGGRVVQRVRSQDPASGPLEVHILDFPSEQALDEYMADPKRASRSALRDEAIERTEVYRVDAVGAP
jgi:uncharacterized protein (DUF1330 family)